MAITIMSGALDKGEKGDIVLRGVIDQGVLGIHPDSPAVIQRHFQVHDGMHGHFMVADYQREVLAGKKHEGLVAAFMAGHRVPDVEIGMRGRSYKALGNGVFVLEDPVFIIDGLQRIASARKALRQSNDGLKIHLGATIYFDSTDEWERARFRTLNLERTKLSPNVHLRNLRSTNKAVEAVYTMTTRQSDFVLAGRVQWGQSQARQELLTALGLMVVLTMLHHRFGNGAKNTSAEQQARSLDETREDIGVRALQNNIREFFKIVDEVWSIRQIAYKERSTHIKQNFLLALAELFTRHGVFWKGNLLEVDRATRQKLEKFPLNDPAVINLVSSSGAGSKKMLFQMLLDHVNSGRRVNRLIQDVNAPEEIGAEETVD